MSGICRSCGARVWWVTTRVSGTRMPLDLEPDPTGLLAVVNPDGTPVPAGDVAGQLESGTAILGSAAGLPADHPRWSSHFATCRWAGTYRRRRRDPATRTT